jgi:hypothetical protein
MQEFSKKDEGGRRSKSYSLADIMLPTAMRPTRPDTPPVGA